MAISTTTDSLPADAARPAGQPAAPLTPRALVWRRLRRDRTGVVAGVVAVAFLVTGLAAPLIAGLYGKSPYEDYGQESQWAGILDDFGFPSGGAGGISSRFWLGVEPGLGRDVFTLLLYGIRNSLLISLVVTVLTILIATVLGVAAGYFGGVADFLIGRVSDILLSFPGLVFYVAFMPVVTSVFVGPGHNVPTSLRVACVVLLLAAFGWMTMARVLRSVVLSLKEQDFVAAAQVAGMSPWRIITRELVPNLTTPLIVETTMLLPYFVMAEAYLAILGVGIQDPTPDWGRMIADSAGSFQVDFAYTAIAGCSLTAFVLACNLFGDSLRDALDSKGAH